MKLLRLSCDKESFHPVTFNKKGISLIVGKKHKPELKEQKKTYNGVGKSLLVSLIHFCLASRKNVQFEEKIPDWEFTLEFEINDIINIVKRNTSKQNVVLLNGNEIEIETFKKEMGEQVFSLSNPIKFLSFRSFISRFIRPTKESYSRFDTFVINEQPINKLMCNGYLLGLDTDIILKKYNLKEEYDRISYLKNNIKKDDIVKKFLTDDVDIELSLIDTKEKIEELENNLKSLKVAEDYHGIEEKANELSYKIKTLKNESFVLENAIKNIDRTLEIKTDISKEDIYKMYEEAEITIPEMVKNKVDEVIAFHSKLIIDREKRLNKEKKELEKELEEKFEIRKKLGKDLDKYLKYLDTHGALEELNSLNMQLQDLKLKFDKLTTYKDVIKEYDNKISELNIKFENENISTNQYLEKVKDLLNRNIMIFRNFSKEFYQDKPGGIEVTNNIGRNTIRFNIDVKIQDDASDGINEVKIFCYDYTILKAQHNHNMSFLFHDSRLFGNMDSRQLTTLFKIAKQESEKFDYQYIASLNEKDLDIIKGELQNDKEYYEIIEKNIILKLTDESEKTKLLGIEVDMN